MKTRMVWWLGCALAWSVPAVAEPAAEGGRLAQNDRAASCAAQAKGLKDEEHRKFVEECLANRGLTPQQNRMKSCNARAREQQLRGDERRTFMSGCLKG